jgi:ribosomal protein L32
MRHTRAHTANRRSHHALGKPTLATTDTGTKHARHRMAEDGTYRGKAIKPVKAAKRK